MFELATISSFTASHECESLRGLQSQGSVGLVSRQKPRAVLGFCRIANVESGRCEHSSIGIRCHTSILWWYQSHAIAVSIAQLTFV